MTLDENVEKFDFIVNVRHVVEGESSTFMANTPVGRTVKINPDYYAPLPCFMTYRGMNVYVHKNSDFYKRLAMSELYSMMKEEEQKWKKNLYNECGDKE